MPFMVPRHCRLEGLHHAEQHVGQGVLNSVVLIGYEGNGMEVAISVRTALQLEYSSLLNAARVIADAFGADVEVIKNRPDLPQVREGLQIGSRLLDLSWAGGLRDLLQQRQPIPVRPAFLHEQIVQHRSQVRRQVRVDQAY